MVAAISPAKSNLDETLSTLRFAQTCKKITTRAARNQESTKSIVEALKAEIEQLRAAAEAGGAAQDPGTARQLKENEALQRKLQEEHKSLREWEDKRKQALEDMGLSMQEITSAMGVDPNTPQLINISDDPSLSGNLVYYLVPGEDTTLGSDKACKIVLTGLGMQSFMLSLRPENTRHVTLTLLAHDGKPMDESDLLALGKPRNGKKLNKHGRVLVNGRVPKTLRQDLNHTDRIIVGHAYCFRLVMPMVAAEASPVSPAEGVVPVSGDIEEALFEVVHEHADEFLECRALMDSIQDRIGSEKAQEFLELFGRTLPLVEEGNLITSTVRPKDNLHFQLEVCSDIMTFTTDEPELIVRLYKGTERSGEEHVIDVSELPQFMDRLSHIREVYTEFQAHPDSLDFSQPGQDPWIPCSYRDLQEVMLEAKHTLDEEVHRRERAESRIAMLERQLADAEALAAAATAVGGNPGDVQDFNGPLEGELRQASQDSLAAARVATKLLGSLQQLQLDIRGYSQQLQDPPTVQSLCKVDSPNDITNGDVKLPVDMRLTGPQNVTLPVPSKRGTLDSVSDYF